MIEVKLEDFEIYREDLLVQANGLLYNSGCGNFKKGEIKDLAKDIVQDTYLEFHKHHKDPFVTTAHLYNFIRMCLYRRYLNTVNLKRSSYNTFKDSNISDVILEGFEGDSTCEDFDRIPVFMKKLDDKQKYIVSKLIEGYTQLEIATQLGCQSHVVVKSMVDIRNIYLNKKIKKELFVKPKVKVKQIDHNGVSIKIWDSGMEAANELDLAASAISNCCKGKRLTHGGYKWEFVK